MIREIRGRLFPCLRGDETAGKAVSNPCLSSNCRPSSSLGIQECRDFSVFENLALNRDFGRPASPPVGHRFPPANTRVKRHFLLAQPLVSCRWGEAAPAGIDRAHGWL